MTCIVKQSRDCKGVIYVSKSYLEKKPLTDKELERQVKASLDFNDWKRRNDRFK